MSELILFSGGCDSTLILYKRAMDAMKSNGGHIKALSISHSQCPAQKMQKKARERIKKEFDARELPITWMHVDIKQDVNTGIEVSGIGHPLIWFPTAALYLKSNDLLYTGYHKGDDYWMYRGKAETAFKNFLLVMDKTDVKIEYPLQCYNKRDVINELKARNIYDLCWYCEYPKDGKPCGECEPCITHRTALWQIDNLKIKEPEVKSTEPQLILNVVDTVEKENEKLEGS